MGASAVRTATLKHTQRAREGLQAEYRQPFRVLPAVGAEQVIAETDGTLTVIGMNSIAAYCIAHLFDGFILKNLKTNLGQNCFKVFSDACEPFLHGAAPMLVFWLILYWMYRRKLFLRI